MKKVLALVLAVMMLSTMAFATTGTNTGGGGTKASNSISINGGLFLPGDKIYVYEGMSVNVPGTYEDINDAVNSDNYSLTKVKYEEGRNLVDDIYFDDDNDQLVIKLKDNTNLTTTKDLEMSFTLKGKKDVDDVDVTIDTSVGYALIKSAYVIDDDGDLQWTEPDFYSYSSGWNWGIGQNDKRFFYEVKTGKNGEPTSVTEGSTTLIQYNKPYTNSVKGNAYGTLEFTTEDTDVDVEVRVYDGDKLYLYNNVDPDKDILKAYADSDAEISFLSFPGDTTFNATATVYMYKPEDSFVYEVKNGKLVESNAKWDDDYGAFVLKARTLGSYVFSDVELDTVTESADDVVDNPDTGANDVVGIAAALGVVALVSAAAVSLKK